MARIILLVGFQTDSCVWIINYVFIWKMLLEGNCNFGDGLLHEENITALPNVETHVEITSWRNMSASQLFLVRGSTST